MTVDIQPLAESYKVAGTGPYRVPHRYNDAAELRVAVSLDGATPVPVFGFHMVPPSSTTGGDLYLSEADAASFHGGTLAISRRTSVQQGWAGASASGRGMEAALDRLAMAVQDLQNRIDRDVPQVPRPLSDVLDLALAPHPGRMLAWSTEGTALTAGPSAEDLQRILDGMDYGDFLKMGMLIPLSEDDLGVECAVGTFLEIAEDDLKYPSVTLEF